MGEMGEEEGMGCVPRVEFLTQRSQRVFPGAAASGPPRGGVSRGGVTDGPFARFSIFFSFAFFLFLFFLICWGPRIF